MTADRLTPDRLTARGRRLASKDPRDHPHATALHCQIPRPHGAHPYGPIHPAGGLAKWCGGKEPS